MRKTIYTIAKKTFLTGTSWKTPVSRLTFFASLFFILAIMSFTVSIISDSSQRNDNSTALSTIVIVNPPDSFARFIDNNTVPEVTDIIGEAHGAYYDFGHFNQLMDDHQAFMTLVFSEDFDALIFDPSDAQEPQLLSYFNIKDPNAVSKHDQVLEQITTDYNAFLLEEQGIPALEHDTFFSTINYTHFSRGENLGYYYFISQMLVPLILFIFVLFVSMESGVAAIAGEKEKGTFARVLLTPTTRIQIVLGHVLGVFLRAIIIPAFIILLMLIFTELDILFSIIAFGIVLSLSFIISTLIVMISVMGKNTVSAQTAFLPIFLILLMVCVMSMQTHASPSFIYYVIPFFGHFNSFASSFLGEFSFLSYSLMTIISFCAGALIILITERLLRTERFTILSDGESGKSIAKARKAYKKETELFARAEKRSTFDFRIKKVKKPVTTILYHFWFPLAVLSFFQFLALILPIRSYLQLDASSEFLQSLTKMIEQYRFEDLGNAAYDLMALLMQQPSFLISMSLGYVGLIFTYALIVKKVEKNSLRTLGFPFKTKAERKQAALGYGKGFLIGVLMIIGIYSVLLLFGQVRPVGFKLTGSSLGLLFAYMVMWIPQGAAEEVMLRGYMMPRIAARFGKPAGVFLSSLLFSLLHAGNPGFNIIAFINLLFISFFFAWLALRTQEIFTVCAAHTAWNFTQGNLLGMTVSGSTGTATLLDTRFTAEASDLITGGAFGPEGGLAVTIVTIIGLAVLYFSGKQRQKTSKN